MITNLSCVLENRVLFSKILPINFTNTFKMVLWQKEVKPILKEHEYKIFSEINTIFNEIKKVIDESKELKEKISIMDNNKAETAREKTKCIKQQKQEDIDNIMALMSEIERLKKILNENNIKFWLFNLNLKYFWK